MPSLYVATILAVTGCTVAEAPLVEGLMRLETPTLDGLSCYEFRRLAFSALDDVRAEPQIAASNAQAYGLI